MTKTLLTSICLLLICSSCQSRKSQEAEIRALPLVTKFEGFFDNSQGKLANFGGMGTGLEWMSQGLAYDRYIVRMGIKLKDGEPQVKTLSIHVQEITKVEIWGTDTVRSKIGETDYSLGYQALVKANTLDELLAMSKLEIIKDQPVKDIDKKHAIFGAN